MVRVGIVGGGKMGEALFMGFTKAGHDVVIVEPDVARAASLVVSHGDVVVPVPAMTSQDVVLIATKPAQVVDVLAEVPIRPGQLVISIAAGVATDTVAQAVPEGTDVVRVMPNTPALVGEGMSVLSAHDGCSRAGLKLAEELLGTVGQVEVVPESDQDAVTAVSGSGPAYIFLVVEAMAEAGRALGLSRDVANKLAAQTVVGAASMLRETGEDPAVLRANVTSPGGTTAAALAEFERGELRELFLAAARAAHARSNELGR